MSDQPEARGVRFRVSLRSRLNFLVAAIVATVIGAQAWLSLRIVERVVERDLLQTAELTAQAVADDLEIRGAVEDTITIGRALRDFLVTAPALQDISVFSVGGGALSPIASTSTGTRQEAMAAGREALRRGSAVWSGVDPTLRVLAVPAFREATPIAVVTVTIALTTVDQMRTRGRQVAVGFAIGAILLLTLLVDQMTRRVVHQRLERIRNVMRRAAGGELAVRTPVDRPDEIGILAEGLNEMLAQLEGLHGAMQTRVNLATQELQQKNVELAVASSRMLKLSEDLARAGRLATLGQTAANVAHQIGTPLNLISGYVQMLIETEPPDTPALERLRAIQDQVVKVTCVVRGVLESARRPVAARQAADLADVVRRVSEMATPILHAAGVESAVSVPERPVTVLADTVQLELALLNLLTNSVDAMSAGGRLSIRLASENGRCRLEVEDSGSGIPPELVPHVFEPWVTTKAPGKGTGLGLSIAREVVQAHGGTITVNSRAGVGTQFTISLPTLEPGLVRGDAGHVENPGRR